MGIVIVGMLDEREAGLRLIKQTIEQRGHKTTLVDISIGTGAIESSLKAQVPCEEVARAGGQALMRSGRCWPRRGTKPSR